MSNKENSKEFEEEKRQQIQKLETQNKFLEDLQKSNYKINILNAEQSSKMEEILHNNEKYLHKLNSNEFEIAIVGLEKAGKSTFANALIGNNILPSAPQRCTFTSTRLTSGEDKAVVEFYTKEEFNTIFVELLKEIEYPNFEKENFETFSIEKFNTFFNSLEKTNSALFKSHIGKTDEEIKDIISCRERLILNGTIKTFSGDNLLSDTFQSYIKGENEGKDTSKPRSVKRVEISSAKLENLSSAIIYDVPGFDSPTQIHERQTLERLKSADAIILVTNVGRNPSLQGTQLNIITKNTDADGIPLRDKLFVFGNQLDTANSEEEADGNIRILNDDIQKYKLGERKRVFTGSAEKYLVMDKNIISKPSYQIKYEIDSGIDKIYKELVNYYENERFEILKRKIDINREELKKIFDTVLQKSETDFDPNFAENEKNRITRESYKNIEESLEHNLRELKSELKSEIWEDRYFSQKFKDSIASASYFKNIDDDTLARVKIYEDDSLTLDTPIEKINQAIRKDLHKQFLNEFSTLIKKITDEKSVDIKMRILRTFTSSILDESNALIFDDIEKECEKIIDKLTADIAHNDGRFTYLIERFSRDIFDILISNPLFTNDRKEKYEKSSTEFEYLDNYYKNGDGTLINLILAGEKKSQISDLTDIATQLVRYASNSHSFSGKLQDVKLLAEKLYAMASSNTKYNIADILKDKKRSVTEDAVKNEINKDIENLKDILQEAVVSAINLESAFLNSIDKQIKILIDSFRSNNTENATIFNDFISKIVPKIKSEEIGSINEKLDNYKSQQEFLKAMKKIDL